MEWEGVRGGQTDGGDFNHELFIQRQQSDIIFVYHSLILEMNKIFMDLNFVYRYFFFFILNSL